MIRSPACSSSRLREASIVPPGTSREFGIHLPDLASDRSSIRRLPSVRSRRLNRSGYSAAHGCHFLASMRWVSASFFHPWIVLRDTPNTWIVSEMLPPSTAWLTAATRRCCTTSSGVTVIAHLRSMTTTGSIIEVPKLWSRDSWTVSPGRTVDRCRKRRSRSWSIGRRLSTLTHGQLPFRPLRHTAQRGHPA